MRQLTAIHGGLTGTKIRIGDNPHRYIVAGVNPKTQTIWLTLDWEAPGYGTYDGYDHDVLYSLREFGWARVLADERSELPDDLREKVILWEIE